MGTRADFYVGMEKDGMEWLGSIAFDGYATALPRGIRKPKDEQAYRRSVKRMLKSRDDATMPNQGWPWPWKDSGTSDLAYAFAGGVVWFSAFGERWHRVDDWQGDNVGMDGDWPDFPDMTAIQAVTLGARSGVLLIAGR
ncbi:MAG: hypothetical protein IMZ50_16405 [Candidatus Atribacteria bacterium]|nr:hypothetical protein [Candidatus Atribacteria bacterium]